MTEAPKIVEVPTPVGLARTTTETGGGAGTLVLGHGAGGGIEAPDLLAARDAGLRVGLTVVRVEQPWRVQGRRIAEAPSRLDLAWRAVLAGLVDRPLVVGGRSAGARVACRTADEVAAAAVLALAFPLVPPGTGRSRLPELLLPQVPRLVVQGSRDEFGLPQAAPGVAVHVVDGADHGFAVRREDGRSAAELRAEIIDVVADWLAQTLT